jgi:hypothetical protein
VELNRHIDSNHQSLILREKSQRESNRVLSVSDPEICGVAANNSSVEMIVKNDTIPSLAQVKKQILEAILLRYMLNKYSQTWL